MKELKPNKLQEMKLDVAMLSDTALNDRACALISQHIHEVAKYTISEVVYATLCRCLYIKWGLSYEIGLHPKYFPFRMGYPHIMFMLRYILTVGDGKEFNKGDLANELGCTVDELNKLASSIRLYFEDGELTESKAVIIDKYFWRGIDPTQAKEPETPKTPTDFQKLSTEIDALKKASEEQAKLISSLSKGVSLIVPTVSENISLLKKEIEAIKEDIEKQPKLTRILIDEKVENPPAIEDAPKAENTTPVVTTPESENMYVSNSKAQENIAVFRSLCADYNKGKISSTKLAKLVQELFDTLIPIDSLLEYTSSVSYIGHTYSFDIIVKNLKMFIGRFRGKEEMDAMHMIILPPKNTCKDFILFNRYGLIHTSVKKKGYASYHTYLFHHNGCYDLMIKDLDLLSGNNPNTSVLPVIKSKYLEIGDCFYRGGGLVTIYYFMCHLVTFGMNSLKVSRKDNKA